MFLRAGGGPLLVQGASGRGVGPAFRGLLPLPSAAPDFVLVRGGFVFYRLRFFFVCRLAVAVVSFLRFFSLASGLLAGAAVSCLCLVGRVRHTSDHTFKLTMF